MKNKKQQFEKTYNLFIKPIILINSLIESENVNLRKLKSKSNSSLSILQYTISEIL